MFSTMHCKIVFINYAVRGGEILYTVYKSFERYMIKSRINIACLIAMRKVVDCDTLGISLRSSCAGCA